MDRPGLLDPNGWTGGQYSLVRAFLGAVLFARFAGRVAFEAGVPGPELVLATAGMLAAPFLVIGAGDRFAALALCGVVVGSAFLHTRGAPVDAGAFVVGWVLLVHALLRRTPFLSLSARGRVDPRGGWTYVPSWFAATWAVLMIAYLATGLARVFPDSDARPPVPLPAGVLAWSAAAVEIAFAPLALLRTPRPWAWLGMLIVHAIHQNPVLFAAHLFAFDPAWIRGTLPGSTDVVFYDGTCGLCHRSVRFLLAEDRTGTAFRFAPLKGVRFAESLGGRPDLPDSVVVHTAAGEALVRSAGLLHALRRLGGLWRVAAAAIGLVPRPLRDGLYDGVARVRYRLFGRAAETCPVLPPDLRSRFVA
jgi:predicted DCC family thiol-disulfide oxidoreductase YuxK